MGTRRVTHSRIKPIAISHTFFLCTRLSLGTPLYILPSVWKPIF